MDGVSSSLPYDEEEYTRHCLVFARACEAVLDKIHVAVEGEAANSVVKGFVTIAQNVPTKITATRQCWKVYYKALKAAGHTCHCESLEQTLDMCETTDINAVYLDTQNGVYGVAVTDDYPLESLMKLLKKTTASRLVVMFRTPRDSRHELNDSDRYYMLPLFTTTQWRIVGKKLDPGALMYILQRDRSIDPATAEFAAESRNDTVYFPGYREVRKRGGASGVVIRNIKRAKKVTTS